MCGVKVEDLPLSTEPEQLAQGGLLWHLLATYLLATYLLAIHTKLATYPLATYLLVIHTKLATCSHCRHSPPHS